MDHMVVGEEASRMCLVAEASFETCLPGTGGHLFLGVPGALMNERRERCEIESLFLLGLAGLWADRQLWLGPAPLHQLVADRRVQACSLFRERSMSDCLCSTLLSGLQPLLVISN